MSRRRRPEKRIILPDPRYGDQVLSKFMNSVMYDGKKAVAVGLGHVVEGDSGHGYSFTAPADAFMIRRWKMKNRIATGIVINTDAASFSG